LSAARHRCAVGEAGEIFIRTPFRSLGYLGAGAEDRRRFEPNPWTGDEDDLLYATGDRGRYREDGVLEILGRMDDQVKIRGMRVEPGEIRAVLLRLPGVADCAVLAREDVQGEKRLVAYVVAAPGGGFDAAEARRGLRRELPDYMVPAVLVLDALPLTPNGKLDRRALPVPEGSRADHLGRYVAPRDRTELELVAIWEELLGVRPIGVEDDFFEIGGHSLLAMRLVSLVQKRFHTSLPLAALLAPGTIEDLAALLERDQGAHVASPVVPLSAGGSRPRFFCVHPGGGGVLCYRDLTERLGPDQPVFAFQARGLEGEAEPASEMAELARTYVAAMKSVQPAGPYLIGGWSFGGKVAFEMACQLEAQGEPPAVLVLFDSAGPTALSRREEVATLLALAAEAGIAVDEEELRRLAPEARLRYLAGLAAAAGAVPDGVGEEHLRRVLAVQQANHHAAVGYQPGIYGGKVVMLRASERLGDDSPGLTAGPAEYGWGPYCAQPVIVLPVPGNHLTMVRPPHVETLAGVLGRVLAGATGRAIPETAP
jgi:thioesterase domain-containing protein/acyl carrier protein